MAKGSDAFPQEKDQSDRPVFDPPAYTAPPLFEEMFDYLKYKFYESSGQAAIDMSLEATKLSLFKRDQNDSAYDFKVAPDPVHDSKTLPKLTINHDNHH